MTKLQKRVAGHRGPAFQGLFPSDDGLTRSLDVHTLAGRPYFCFSSDESCPRPPFREVIWQNLHAFFVSVIEVGSLKIGFGDSVTRQLSAV